MDDIRDFTETEWYAFGGAEAFRNGDQPIVREMDIVEGGLTAEALVVADANGVEVHAAMNWRMSIEFPCQAAARVFLAGLPCEFNPAEIGFEIV